MKLVVSLMMSYLYTDMLLIYVFGNICGFKYSKKITVLGTIALWMSDCILKIFPQYIFGIQITGYLNVLMIITSVIYCFALYNSSMLKKILVLLIYIFAQASMDVLGMNIAGILTGEYAFLDVNSNFTVVMICCSAITITLGTVIFVWLWKLLERKNWSISKFQWLCLMLPLSQYIVIQSMAIFYTQHSEAIPTIVGGGLILGLLADIYMMLLFEKSNRNKLVEKELQQLKHQYELEQLRYEQLKAGQEETVKIRHDFQNYIMTLKRME